MGLTVGIDLGTTYTVIARVDESTKKPEIIRNKFGQSITPSVIAFMGSNEYMIGEEAKAQGESGNVNTFSFYKLHMGDPSFKVRVYGREFTARDLSSIFLRRLVEEVSSSLGQPVTDAVITVPAYFGDAAKNDTIKAGEAAGLNVINIISEPTAACIAFGLNDKNDQKVLIYDLGGGTFDVTIADIQRDAIRVMATNGHHQLGGRDWDKSIVEWIVEKVLEDTGEDISDNEELMSMILVKAEQAKKQLTTASYTDISVETDNGKKRYKLTREEFEALTSYQLEITKDIIRETFDEIGISWKDLAGAVLVGGSTKMPMVKNYIKENGVHVLDGVHPDEAVAIGAAIQANISRFCALDSEDKKISSLRLAVEGKKADYARLPGAKRIEDVISHSLGMIIENAVGNKYINDIMIPRNTFVGRANKTKDRELMVSKRKENNKLDIYLLQGESTDPSDCDIAKRYVFHDIDYVDGGRTMLSITYKHTFNGVIDISAVQKETGKSLPVTEERIPEDMSWVNMDPREHRKQMGVGAPSAAVIMALDTSGSMSGSPMVMAKNAMADFVTQFEGTGIMVGVELFADKNIILCKPTDNYDKVRTAITNIQDVQAGVCNGEQPMDKVLSMMADTDLEMCYCVVLTDGQWESEACRRALLAKAKFQKRNYEVIGMGFGSADSVFLKKLSTMEDLSIVEDISKLSGNLSSIAKEIIVPDSGKLAGI